MKKRTIKEEKISLETAKLAKEKGFANGTRASYCHYLGSYVYDGDPDHRESYKKDDVRLDPDFYTVNNMEGLDYSNEHYSIYEAPSQSLLKRWLREEHNIHLSPQFSIKNEVVSSWWCYLYPEIGGGRIKLFPDEYGNPKSYEEALEVGLIEALKLI